MATVKKNIFLQGISGSIGGQIVVRNVQGQTILAKAPGKRNLPASPKQQARQDLFQKATLYAKSVKFDSAVVEAYRKKLRGPFDTAYHRAITDFLHSPKVTQLDLSAYKGKSGGLIRIQAEDDFMVQRVMVQVVAPNGLLLEEGEAIAKGNGVDWEYQASVDVGALEGCKVVGIAVDTPGNRGVMERVL